MDKFPAALLNGQLLRKTLKHINTHSHGQTSISLLPTALPAILDLPQPMIHTEGDHFELVCTFVGTPPPKIVWEKDGNEFLIEEGRRVINSTESSQLMINHLLLSDAGVYTCSMINVAGTDMRSVRLEVRGEGVST